MKSFGFTAMINRDLYNEGNINYSSFIKNKNTENVKKSKFPIAHLCKALYNYHILRKAPVKGF